MIILTAKDMLSTYNNPSWWNAKECIKISKERSWLPLRTNSKRSSFMAYLTGLSMGDGHIDKNFTIKVSCSTEQIAKKLRQLINEELKIPISKMKIYKQYSWGISYNISINDCRLGRLLSLLGVPRGRKSNSKFHVPKWIKLTKSLKRSFLQGILEAELAHFKLRKKRNSPNASNFKMTKNNAKLKRNLIYFLNEIRGLLEEFDIETGKVKYGYTTKYNNYEALFWIQSNRANVLRFRNNIGYRVEDKTSKLNDYFR